MRSLPVISELKQQVFSVKREELDAVIVGPDQGEDPYQEGSRKNFSGPPLGAYTVAHFAEAQGFKTTVWDPNLDGKKGLYELIRDKRPPVLGFSILHETLEDDVRNIVAAKEASPDSTIVIGGFEATLNWRQLFTEVPMIDVAVLGMGEKTFSYILSSAQQGRSVESIPGIVYRKGLNDLVETSREKYTSSDFVDALNNLDFGRVPYPRYWNVITSQGRASLNTIRIMLTANDCNYNCSFCTVPEFWSGSDKQRIQRGPILEDDVSIAQIVRAVRLQPDTQAFYIEDDNFGMNPKRMESVARGIIRAKEIGYLPKDIKFFCQLRAESLLEQTLKVMCDAGFTVLSLGIESFSPNVLNELTKAGPKAGEKTAKKWDERLNMILGVPGLTPSMFMILFTPQSTVDDVKLTMDTTLYWVNRGVNMNLNGYMISYPGAPMEANKYETLTYRRINVPNTTIDFKVTDLVMPINKDVKNLAEEAYKRQERAVMDLSDEYNLPRDKIPLVIEHLVLFREVYSLITDKKGQKNATNMINERLSELTKSAGAPVNSYTLSGSVSEQSC
ncbi:hypothetical protein COV18_02075 [Candidatus Woesearchaeota archaeon CG10_big_fil_rev_8_21_14_0_10_37_12]|nr:MAG: hypothetical protein COV18_02075 [Candidatus Woesearchaeota archaeon CG10_big_fil_rev_8_21_14_0_10_37_12]